MFLLTLQFFKILKITKKKASLKVRLKVCISILFSVARCLIVEFSVLEGEFTLRGYNYSSIKTNY